MNDATGNTPPQSPKGPATSAVDEAHRERMKKTRRLVIQTLAAAGAIDLTGWQAQAHGNRSSHSACLVAAFAPEDYVVMRQVTLAPSAEESKQLKAYQDQLDAIAKQTADVSKSSQYQQLLLAKQTLEQKLQLRPVAKQALDLIKAGKPDAATQLIEGSGDNERVLANYLWTLLDFAHMGQPNSLKQTAANAEQFLPLAQSATRYAQNVLDKLEGTAGAPVAVALKVRAAEVLYNVAGLSVPDSGKVPEALRKLAKAASERELAVRTELQQKLELGRSYWMVGEQYFVSGDLATAKDYFTRAVDQTTKNGDRETLAWSQVYLGKTMQKQDPQGSRRLIDEGLALAKSLPAEPDKNLSRLQALASDQTR